MVNNPNGPLLFYLMCASACLVTLAYYFSKGWIEVHTIQNYFAKLLCGRKRNKPRFAVEEDSVRSSVASSHGTGAAASQRPVSVRRLLKKTSAAARQSESDWRVHEAVEEEARRQAETARKRSRAQVSSHDNAHSHTCYHSDLLSTALRT